MTAQQIRADREEDGSWTGAVVEDRMNVAVFTGHKTAQAALAAADAARAKGVKLPKPPRATEPSARQSRYGRYS